MPALDPILDGHARVLILGSMPSQLSLKHQQYYAHPQNAFWWIMSQLYGFDTCDDYQVRCDALKASGVGVWDVLHDCVRPGSLDSNIDRKSEVSNDFSALFETHGSICRLIFNGAASLAIFKRHNKKLLQQLVDQRLEFKWTCCPSTSPAHAAMSKHDKLIAWRSAIN